MEYPGHIIMEEKAQCMRIASTPEPKKTILFLSFLFRTVSSLITGPIMVWLACYMVSRGWYQVIAG